MKKLLTAAISLIVLWCADVPPACSFDISLFYGRMGIRDIELDDDLHVFGVGVARFFRNIGVEGGFEYAPNAGFEFDRPGIGDFDTSMANLYGNILAAWFFEMFEPYATAGFGLNITRAKGTVLGDRVDLVDRAPAFNYGFGTYVNLRTFLLRFDYRRFAVKASDEEVDPDSPLADLGISTRADLDRWTIGVVFMF